MSQQVHYPVEIIDGQPQKTCSQCLKTQPLRFFHADKSKSTGFRPACAACKQRTFDKWRAALGYLDRHKSNNIFEAAVIKPFSY